MIRLKSKEDIVELRKGGRILAEVLDELSIATKAGVTTLALDALAQELIKESGCQPAFLGYAGGGGVPYPAALCVSVNETVVHGIPGNQVLNTGDVVGLDLGLVYKGKYYLDSARTVIVGPGTAETRHLVAVTYEALSRGIIAAVSGNRIGDIGATIQKYVEGQGFEVVRQLVGHGVGFAVHEEPQVPNFGRAGKGLELKPGLVIAIEPMVTKGDPLVETASDGWAVVIKSREWSAHAEHTIAITPDGPEILTLSPRDY